MEEHNHNNIATFIHLSTFSRFVIPFGNFIGPVLLWAINRDKSDFIDQHGKQAINFQISVFLYALIIGLITIPYFIFNLVGHLDFIDFHAFESLHFNIDKPSPLLFIGGSIGLFAVLGFILELAFIIIASQRARDGLAYKYPLCITFLK